MAKTREKKRVITGVTREMADASFAVFAEADAKQQRITAKMDQEITRIRERYQDDLVKLQESKDDAFDVIQTFAMENKDQLFGKKKSIETLHGIFGFRTSTPSLKTLKGFTWPAVTNMLKELLPAYVRTKDEPNKDKLIDDREVPEVAGLFAKCGFYVAQDETFFVEPKKEEISAE